MDFSDPISEVTWYHTCYILSAEEYPAIPDSKGEDIDSIFQWESM